MTTEFLELGGEKRPVRFGFEALYSYERKTGKKALEDFQALQSGGQVPITLMVDLVWSGLFAGYRKEEIPVDFDEYNVAEWLSEDQTAFARVMELFTASLVTTSEKKTKPRPEKNKA